MAKPHKFRPGASIKTLAELELCLYERRWIYMWQTPKHPRVIECMTIGTIRFFMAGKSGLREAIYTNGSKEPILPERHEGEENGR